MAARRTTKKAAPAPEVVEDDTFEEIEDDDLAEVDDLEELDDAEEEPAPKRGRKSTKTTSDKPTANKTQASGFDSNWLAEHINENVAGQDISSREVRMVLRKLAKDGELAREVGTDRARYDFPKGANDPTVKKVVQYIKSGAAKADKTAKLAEVKEKAAAAPKTKTTKAAAKATPARRTRKATQDA